MRLLQAGTDKRWELLHFMLPENGSREVSRQEDEEEMNRVILDATAISAYLRCREEYRRTYIENAVPARAGIHLAFGASVHVGAYEFWKDTPFNQALEIAFTELHKTPLEFMTPKDTQTWARLVEMLPDMLAAYYDSVERVELLMNETEWHLDDPLGVTGVTLAGRVDRVKVGPVLSDLKTASEIGSTWKSDYRQTMLRDFGLSAYDFYLCQVGLAPVMVELEVLVKAYGTKPCRFERFEFGEIPLLRRRFEQQLKFILAEIKHAHESYAEMKPWVMSTSACHGRFGACAFLKLCNGGKLPLVPRKEHLAIRAAQAVTV